MGKDRPLSREERRIVEKIAFLRRLGIYNGIPPMPRGDKSPEPPETEGS